MIPPLHQISNYSHELKKISYLEELLYPQEANLEATSFSDLKQKRA